MFGWFSPKCPVNTLEKAWTETRMRWLADRLGIERMLRAEVILPTEQHFPETYHGTVDDARRVMDRTFAYMGLPPRPIDLEVCADFQLPGAVGLYEKDGHTIIRVAETQLADPHKLTATLAHELAHEMLLGDGLLTGDEPDHEWVTDLLPVYLGLGVFLANAVLCEDCGQQGHWSWWTMSRQGYLPARVFGYAFALFAWLRDEPDPEWARHLRLDAASALKDGLHYLRQTGDSLFHPNTVRDRRRASPRELVERLHSTSPSARMAALWEIRDRGEEAADACDAVIQRLRDRDLCIPGEAARALPALGPAAVKAVPDLVRALSSRQADTRAGAAYALGVLGQADEVVIPELSALLGEGNQEVVAEAAGALRAFGRRAESAVPQLLDAWTRAIIDCDQRMIEVLAGALIASAEDARRVVRGHFRGDPELRRQALDFLKEQQGLGSTFPGGIPAGPSEAGGGTAV